VLGIAAFPVNWPLGDGPEFRGVFDRQANLVHSFERVPGGHSRSGLGAWAPDPFVRDQMTAEAYARMTEELAMLDGAGARFDHASILAGQLTPVFLASAVNNFGVQLPARSFSRTRATSAASIRE